MRRRYAAIVIRARWPIIVAWIAAAVASALWLPGVDEAGGGSLGALVPTRSEAIEAERRSAEHFRFPVLSRVAIVQRDPGGLPGAVKLRTLDRAADVNLGRLPQFSRVLGAFPIVGEGGASEFLRDPGTTALTYLLLDPDLGTGTQTGIARRFVRESFGPAGAVAGVTGTVPAHAAQAQTIKDHLPLVELATVLLVGLAVAIHFRALVAPLLTLVSVGISYVVAIGVVSGIGRDAGLSVPKEVEPVMVVLLFGILTDYALFFLTRFRRRLAEGEEPRSAAEGTIADLIGIVAAAGLAVMGGCASLLVAQLSFFQVFGPGVAVSIGIGLLVALTFLPAALAALGRRTFWPTRPGEGVNPLAAEERAEGARPVRSRSVRLAARRPLVVVIGCTLVLLACASGLRHLEVGQTLIRGLPADAEPRQAYHQAARGFTPGVLSPTLLLVEGPRLGGRRAALAQVQRRVEDVPGVALVVGPRQQRFNREFGVVLSREGTAARMLVFLDSDPLGARAIHTVERLRREAGGFLAAQAVTGRASLAGDTAVSAEIVAGTREDLGRIAPIALIVVGLVLVVFLRALVAPLYLLAASALALAAALGITVYVFQGLLDHGELTYYVPFVSSVLLLSLGSDYNVFLAGRVWEEAKRRPIREAVAVGGSRAASAITVAGIVLALSFALLALVPLRPFRELAFVMFVGLILDAFFVRTLLVPALLALVGRRSSWPGPPLGTPEGGVDGG